MFRKKTTQKAKNHQGHKKATEHLKKPPNVDKIHHLATLLGSGYSTGTVKGHEQDRSNALSLRYVCHTWTKLPLCNLSTLG